MSDLDYPRPLLVRPQWQDLTGPWGFAAAPEDQGRARGWHQDAAPFTATIQVPFPPESELSGIADPDCPDVVWYRRDVAIDRLPGSGERLLLHFAAVDYRARVWVNGVHAGDHEGGHTPFTFDVTEMLVAGADQVVVVRAEDVRADAEQPRGKQDWRPEPHGIWYHRTTGIWQPVWVEVVPDLHVRAVHWTPDVPGASVALEIELSHARPSPVAVHVRLALGEDVLADQTFRMTGDADHPSISHVTRQGS